MADHSSYADDGAAKVVAPARETATPAAAPPAASRTEEAPAPEPTAPREETQPARGEIEYDDDDVDFDLGNDEPSAPAPRDDSYGSPHGGHGFAKPHNKEEG
jgi:hypothetical protein